MTPPHTPRSRLHRSAVGPVAALVAAVLIGLVLAAGCGRPPTRHAVSGSVFFEGLPAQGAGVLFCRDGARPAAAVTDDAGTFVLRTWQDGDGAAAGEHVVCVSKFVPIEGKDAGKDASAYADSRNALPNRYASPLTSPLRAEVSPDGKNHFRFDLEP